MNKINKKAQAQIITTILIILLVLASIVIVWNVVDKAISESSSQVDVQPFLLKGDLEYSMVSSDEVKVEVNRGAGGGEILGVKIIFTDYEGNKYNYDSDPDKFPNELETEVYEIFLGQLNPNDLSSFHKIKEISFYFIYSKNSKEAFTQEIGSSDSPQNISNDAGYFVPGENCIDDEKMPCGTDVGVCKKGNQTCSSTVWGVCDGVGPAIEICDGLDNDCDNSIDENEGNCSGYCMNGSCVECKINENCPEINPYCMDGSCVECKINENCPDVEENYKNCVLGICEYYDVLYYEDFESGVVGWEHSNLSSYSDTWNIVTETCNLTRIFSSSVYGSYGNKCGTDNNEDSYLMSSLIDLSQYNNLSSINLSFSSWAYDEGGECISSGIYDSKEVGISIDNGETWTVLNDCYSLHDYNEGIWKDFNFDISLFKDNEIRIIFVYKTMDGCCNSEEGWYIDNIGIIKIS